MRRHLLIAVAISMSFFSGAAQASDAHCASAEKQVAAMTSKMPIEIDAVTQTINAEVSCENKMVTLSRSVELRQSRMEADFKDFLQKQDNNFVCSDTARLALIKASWKWVFSYKFQDGQPIQITATCGN